jgi:hypothetical protein
MKKLEAYSISIGVLGAVDTYLTGTLIPLPVWVTAIVCGFASTVGTTVATGTPITTVSLANPAIVAGAAMVLGGVFGYLSEIWGDALCGEGKSVESKSTAGGRTS